MQFLIEIISSTMVAGVVTAALVWLTKSVISERLRNAIKSEYDQKLETHKVALKSTSDVEIERLRSQLNIIAAQGNFKFTKLHEKRAETIAEIYALLADFHFLLSEYTKAFEPSGGKPRSVRRDETVNAHWAFIELYRKKKLFLPKSVAEKIDDLDRRLRINYHNFFYEVDSMQAAKINIDVVPRWFEVNDEMSRIIKPALEELEHDFRVLLGDQS
jgi:hypothetical protein